VRSTPQPGQGAKAAWHRAAATECSSMTADEQQLPTWVTWQHRPFPDASLLLLRGRDRIQHPDAHAVTRRAPGCCQAEYLDQPVGPYTVDEPLNDGQVVRLGEADWEIVRTPGHTPGHLVCAGGPVNADLV
jgi:hypothetical protein